MAMEQHRGETDVISEGSNHKLTQTVGAYQAPNRPIPTEFAGWIIFPHRLDTGAIVELADHTKAEGQAYVKGVVIVSDGFKHNLGPHGGSRWKRKDAEH